MSFSKPGVLIPYIDRSTLTRTDEYSSLFKTIQDVCQVQNFLYDHKIDGVQEVCIVLGMKMAYRKVNISDDIIINRAL